MLWRTCCALERLCGVGESYAPLRAVAFCGVVACVLPYTSRAHPVPVLFPRLGLGALDALRRSQNTFVCRVSRIRVRCVA